MKICTYVTGQPECAHRWGIERVGLTKLVENVHLVGARLVRRQGRPTDVEPLERPQHQQQRTTSQRTCRSPPSASITQSPVRSCKHCRTPTVLGNRLKWCVRYLRRVVDEVPVDGVVVGASEEYPAKQPKQVRLQVSQHPPVFRVVREPLRTKLRQPSLWRPVAVVEAELLRLSLRRLQHTVEPVQELLVPVRRHDNWADRGTIER
jgi:alkylated DNA nucleotide flippase Atl1